MAQFASRYVKSTSLACALCGSDDEKDIKPLFASTFESISQDPNQTIRLFSARRTPDRIHHQIVQCKNDTLVRSHHFFLTPTLTNLYTQSSFTYESELSYLKKTYMNLLKPVLLNLPKGARILEIGCANGFMLEELTKEGFSDCQGLELSNQAVSKASKQIREKIFTTTLQESKLQKESYDLIFLFQTFDHIHNPNEFLDQCYNLLKRSGKILSYHHNVESVSAKLLQESSPIFDIEHAFLYSPRTSRAIFERNGFIVQSVLTPTNTLSLQHLFQLLPLAQSIKRVAQYLRFLNKISLQLPLGNICIIAKKP